MVTNIAFINRNSYAPGFYWANKESMNVLAPSFYEEGNGIKLDNDFDKYFQGFKVSAKDGVKFYTDEYLYDSDFVAAKNNYHITPTNFLPDYTNTQLAFDANYILRYYVSMTGMPGFGYNKGYTNPSDAGFGYEYWTLGSYHGKTFVVRLVFQQSAEMLMGSGKLINSHTVQAIGIFCLNNSTCTRSDDGTDDNDNKTTLIWADGTQVSMDNNSSDTRIKSTDSSVHNTEVSGSIVK